MPVEFLLFPNMLTRYGDEVFQLRFPAVMIIYRVEFLMTLRERCVLQKHRRFGQHKIEEYRDIQLVMRCTCVLYT